MTEAQEAAAREFAKAMRGERVGLPASPDEHAGLRLSAVQFTGANLANSARIARFLIDGVVVD